MRSAAKLFFLLCVVLGGVVTPFAVELCFAQAAADTTSSISAKPPVVSTPAVEVQISGNPSSLRVPNLWPWESTQRPCASFRISAAATIGVISLYTTGLGQTTLAVVAADPGNACPNVKTWSDRIVLNASSGTPSIDTFISLKIDTDTLATPGASMQGSVIAIASDRKVGEFSLKLESAPRHESWTAVIWVLSVLVPAVITFLIGQAVTRINAQQKADAEFRDHRLIRMGAITSFFTEVDRVIRSQQKHPGETVYALIVQAEMFGKMPQDGVLAISKACVADDLKALVAALEPLFPEFEKSFRTLKESLQNRTA